MEANPFDKSPANRALYDFLLERVKSLGPVVEENKKTSAHIVAGKGAFLGVHPRSDGLLVNIVLDRELGGERVAKREQVSKSRYHNEVRIFSPQDIDEELMGWIRDAYQLKVAAAEQR
jgi:hypothetical protein